MSYRLLDEAALAPEIAAMKTLIGDQYETLAIDQDLGLGMMLWLAHFFPEEDCARIQTARSLAALDRMWVDPPGCFARSAASRGTKFAFTNYGVSVGLQAANVRPERVDRLNAFFESYRSGDEYDTEAITHVMACSSHFPGVLIGRRADG